MYYFTTQIISYLLTLFSTFIRYSNYNYSDIYTCTIQLNIDLDYVVVHLPDDCHILTWARFCLHKLVSSDLNSKRGIRVIPERPNSNPVNLNVIRQGVLRQYYGCESPPNYEGIHDTSLQPRFLYGVIE